MALAKLYRLPLESDPDPPWLRQNRPNDGEAATSRTFSVEELTSIVVAIAPRNGGLIRAHPDQVEGQETRYQIFDST